MRDALCVHVAIGRNLAYNRTNRTMVSCACTPAVAPQTRVAPQTAKVDRVQERASARAPVFEEEEAQDCTGRDGDGDDVVGAMQEGPAGGNRRPPTQAEGEGRRAARALIAVKHFVLLILRGERTIAG